MLFWEPPYKGAAFEDLETLDCVSYQICHKHPGAWSSYITFWHLPGNTYLCSDPTNEVFRYQNFVKFIISYNFILSQGGREGEVNDFIWKETVFLTGKDYLKSPKGSWDMSTFLLAPRSGTHSPFQGFPRRQFKCINGVEVKLNSVGINFCFLQGWDLWLWSSQKLSQRKRGEYFWAPDLTNILWVFNGEACAAPEGVCGIHVMEKTRLHF